MPRTARASRGGYVYHVLNRRNAQQDVFHKNEDFAAFVNLMVEANERLPMRLVGYCLMTNHFHRCETRLLAALRMVTTTSNAKRRRNWGWSPHSAGAGSRGR